MSFEQLGLSSDILKAIADQGYTIPTPIQSQAIPAILKGKDVMGGAQTGTGKTAGFTLPMLRRLEFHANSSMSPAKHPIRGLILVPTRELAVQVYESVKTYGKYLKLKSTVIYGGVNIDPQIQEVRAGVEILVATPGRLLDHIQQKTLVLSKIEILVLDEADRMLDMGFMPDIKRILELMPAQRQSLMFSATFSTEIKKLADKILRQPVLIEVAKRNSISELVTHVVHPVDQKNKQALLVHLIKSKELKQALIFMRTKHGADRLVQQLVRNEIVSAAIHGDKNQLQRTQALEDFKQGEIEILVATDVAARGLDIEDLTYVINFELPNNPEDYVHRIGRTGRAGAKGYAISLVCEEENILLSGIEKLLKTSLIIEEVAGFEGKQSSQSNGRNDRSGRSGRHDERKTTHNRKRTDTRQQNDKPPRRSTGKRPHARQKPSDDPLFTQPYIPQQREDNTLTQEVSNGDAKPENQNKHKRPIAALFKAPVESNKDK